MPVQTNVPSARLLLGGRLGGLGVLLGVSRKLEFPLTDSSARFADASADFKFAAAVAEFGMILRDSPHKGTGTLADVLAWAQAGSDSDAGGYRSEFTGLVRQAETLVR